MPRDTQQPLDAPPDLVMPSLAGLAWLLRHKEAWPEGFVWDFSECTTCAVGMARQLWYWPSAAWGGGFTQDASVMWDMSWEDAFDVFTAGHSDVSITPEVVACRIDAYLATESSDAP